VGQTSLPSSIITIPLKAKIQTLPSRRLKLALLRGNWVSCQTLAIALSRMVEERLISEAEVLRYAAGILLGNALHVYEKTVEKENAARMSE